MQTVVQYGKKIIAAENLDSKVFGVDCWLLLTLAFPCEVNQAYFFTQFRGWWVKMVVGKIFSWYNLAVGGLDCG